MSLQVYSAQKKKYAQDFACIDQICDNRFDFYVTHLEFIKFYCMKTNRVLLNDININCK